MVFGLSLFWLWEGWAPLIAANNRYRHAAVNLSVAMMNWLLLTYSAGQLPAPFVPFSGAEVAALRPDLEANPEKTRMRILNLIAQQLPSLASELDPEIGK